MQVKDAMHARIITIEPHATLPEAVVKMQELKMKRLPVVHEGKLVGLLTDGEVRRNLPALSEGLTPWEFAGRAGRVRVRDAMRSPVLTATLTEELNHAIKQMLERRVGGLPVVDDDGMLRGMLTLTDVLRAEQGAPRLTWGSVDQHMTGDVVSVQAGDPASDAAAKLKVSRLRVLPVLEGQRLVGLLHEVDVQAEIEREVAARGARAGSSLMLADQTVRQLMRAPTGYLPEGAPMRDAMQRMVELDVHGLPVVDGDGHLLGVVTISDILKIILGQK
ncbi:CBS domain-containing protein [Deinococcus fonticola]|uniref:CBS domain-containing protein n=1 Tax=Deinococcus fonticola TaxID=2528713 RepID=UPI00142FCF01|nr:CBS domain-containing protein [Deinococcus fonticola]